ncbi:cyclic nucleotide-binding domain-containing protein 2-like [Saccostrea echinata]|uniref:cyclic nucleotide-binding domain-containing protein 2-like n=1 Tax=Saccostrea echinata TaxID=191078 RepID=UPI002A831CC9|nr:cyclic nucleotide-binding domain-containing protein 2-like [Saccostrea echinata]
MMKKRNSGSMNQMHSLLSTNEDENRFSRRNFCHSAPVKKSLLSMKNLQRKNEEEKCVLSSIKSSEDLDGFSKETPNTKKAMPCRCKSLGEDTTSTSPCLITQSKANLLRTPTPSHRIGPHVFDHLKSSLQERHKTFVRKTKAKSPTKTPSEEDENASVFKDEKSTKVRFKMAAKCVAVLIRWLNAIIQISDTKTIRTATEERWYTLYTSREARRLAFNKMVYSKERAFAKVPKWALDIFDTDPDSRSEKDCRRIHALLRGLKSFDKFTERIQLYMCRAFRYQSVEPGRVILRRGHVGINFYFIYSGSVFVNVDDIDSKGDHFEKTETVLVRGDSFGELALLQDIRRTATITCRETCEVLVVDKETFAKVCPSIFQEELEEKEKFLTQLTLFNSKYWTKDMMRALCNDAQIQEYKTNKVVATDRRDEEWIYICMQGKGQVIRRLLLDGPSTSKRQRIKSTTSISRHKTPEVLINLLEDDEPDSQDGSSLSPGESDDEEGKEKMLESMSLEYRKDGRRTSFLTHLKWEADIQRKKAMKTPNREEIVKKKQEMVIHGPTTLTSLMSKDKENTASEFIYLHIDTVSKEDVFDIYSILHHVTSPPDSDVLLVSGGARFLRIKKRNFFQICSREALEQSKRIAMRSRYPTNNQLLTSYTEKFHWDNYKNVVVDQVIRPHVERQTRFKNSPDLQSSIINFQRQRTIDLINTLKQHSQ